MGDDPRDQFSAACELAGTLKVRIEGGGSHVASPLEFRQPYLVVGRDRLADVPIDGMDVSRRHAYFQVVAGRVFCVDLGSRTGVRWADGARPVGWVDPARGVGIGPVRVRFEGNEAGQGGNLPISRSFEWRSLPDARLEFPEGGPGRRSWQVSRALVLIGSSRACRVHLTGPEVGGIHAAIVRTPAGVWVVDLLWPGGVLVGGSPTRSARLEDGDEIGLGNHRILVRLGRAARPPGRSELAGLQPSRAMCPSPGEIAEIDRSAGPGDAATARLLDEFGRMHRRTTEQFQRAILMMFRMHQDQMDVIRDGPSKLDRPEDGRRSLRAEPAPGSSSRPPRVASRPISGAPADLPPRLEGPPTARAPSRSAWGPPIAPAVARGRDEDDPPPALEAARGHRLPPEPDPHALLSRKLAEIQDERQGFWKRLLGSLTGGESGRGLP